MLKIIDKNFYLNGEKINIYSGTMHYFRIPREYWEDRLLKLKAAGFNTVETYVAWNIHEPQQGVFDFEGQNDLIEYISTAAKIGLYVIVRPGPYICAEWDFGGFPAWLLKDENILLRCYSEPYITYVRNYFNVLIPKLVDLQETHGGPIIMMQIENEYGSYGSDKKYLGFLRDLMRKLGIDITLFTSDGESRYHLSGGSLPEEFKVVNFGGYPADCFHDLRTYQPNMPLMCGEMWCGWFDHYYEKHHFSDELSAKQSMHKILTQFFSENASFNFYMFHGGTNFGYMSGANYQNFYQPTTTSYDYDAPLNEYGDYTPKYFVMREELCKHRGIEPPTLPPRPVTQSIGKVSLTQTGSLLSNLKNISSHFKDHIPHYMEHYGQNYGMILYHTVIEGDYPDTSVVANGIHDYAFVYINGELAGKYNRAKPMTKREIVQNKNKDESLSVPIPAFKGKIEVDILVEGMGRINFGKGLCDRKGIESVFIGEQYVYDFDIYTISPEKTDCISFDSKKELPLYLKGKFKTDKKYDCFVDMSGFTKGFVFINGFNLGRYWNVGPQRTLYLPGVLLKDENEIIILELEKYKNASVKITDTPSFR